jgi:hypothetical protein
MQNALVQSLTALTLLVTSSVCRAQSTTGVIFQDGLEPESSAAIAWRSDEFDTPLALSRFQQIWQRESWPFDSLQRRTITGGQLLMVPHSSGWWEDYRAELTYQEISGDFMVTTAVHPRNRVGLDAGTGAPGSTFGGPIESEYSLGGLMIRAPRPDVEQSNSNWRRGGEAYVFLAMGAADLPGVYKFEDKTTLRNPNPPNPSQSVRLLTPIAPPTNSAYLRIVRVGAHVLLLVQAIQAAPCCAQPWQVLRRYRRADFPQRLQVGLVAYSDWATLRQCSYEFHNNNRLLQSCTNPAVTADPDLAVGFDFYRLLRPDIPANLAQADWSNPAAISDQQIISTFGAMP